jgi:preprotein translocase subunit SecE
MRRQTLVNALLIIAGMVLAFALFAAGVLWHSRAGS